MVHADKKLYAAVMQSMFEKIVYGNFKLKRRLKILFCSCKCIQFILYLISGIEIFLVNLHSISQGQSDHLSFAQLAMLIIII